jgi:ribosomal protein S18 acetylase RimI-like enzyme
MLGSGSYPIFVAQGRDDKALLGCVIGKVVDNKPFAVPRFGYIGCLYVDDGWRGQELGCRLLGEAQGWFKTQGLDVSQSDVASRSPIARRFWERMGFSRFLDHLYYTDDGAVAKVEDRGVVIRAATVGDAAAVLSLWMEMMDYHARLDRRLRVSPDGSRHVGKAIEHWLLDLKPAKYGHIAHMCVTSEWRRRGVGRQLFTALRRWLQGEGLASVHIYVSHFNPASQRFWRSLGFQDYVDRLWCDLR